MVPLSAACCGQKTSYTLPFIFPPISIFSILHCSDFLICHPLHFTKLKLILFYIQEIYVFGIKILSSHLPPHLLQPSIVTFNSCIQYCIQSPYIQQDPLYHLSVQFLRSILVLPPQHFLNPCVKTGTSSSLYNTLTHFSCRILAFISDMITFAIFLPLYTFWQHSPPSVLN